MNPGSPKVQPKRVEMTPRLRAKILELYLGDGLSVAAIKRRYRGLTAARISRVVKTATGAKHLKPRHV